MSHALLFAVIHMWNPNKALKQVSNVDFHFLGEINGGAHTENMEYLY